MSWMLDQAHGLQKWKEILQETPIKEFSICPPSAPGGGGGQGYICPPASW